MRTEYCNRCGTSTAHCGGECIACHQKQNEESEIQQSSPIATRLSEGEIDYILETVDGLKVLMDYHYAQETMAEPFGYVMSAQFHAKQAAMYAEKAKKIRASI